MAYVVTVGVWGSDRPEMFYFSKQGDAEKCYNFYNFADKPVEVDEDIPDEILDIWKP